MFFPKDAHLSPARLMPSLAQEARKAGVSISYGTAVEGLRAKGHRVEAVRTNRGDLTAGEFVLAGGVRSAELARGLGLKLPMQAGKGYSL